jgi:indole-3-glycerol phosphate synthase
MSSFLAEMRTSSLARLLRARAQEPEHLLLRSPAAGDLSARTPDLTARLQAYVRGGACAVSVLTEPSRFNGSLQQLARAAVALADSNVPVMRKDFLLDPYQIMEARVAGAGGVLVIVRLVDRDTIAALLDCAAQLQMFVLLEAFDAADLAIARQLLARRRGRTEQVLMGLNCRDLSSLRIELQRLVELRPELPAEYAPVAESGVDSLDDIRTVAGCGYRVALVGTALMSSVAPGDALRQMLVAGRDCALGQTQAHRSDTGSRAASAIA